MTDIVEKKCDKCKKKTFHVRGIDPIDAKVFQKVTVCLTCQTVSTRISHVKIVT